MMIFYLSGGTEVNAYSCVLKVSTSYAVSNSTSLKSYEFHFT